MSGSFKFLMKLQLAEIHAVQESEVYLTAFYLM